MYIRRKIIRSKNHKITFKIPIVLRVRRMEGMYVVSHKKALIYGFESTLRKSIRDLTECIRLEYNYYRRKDISHNEFSKLSLKYYKKIIKSIWRIHGKSRNFKNVSREVV